MCLDGPLGIAGMAWRRWAIACLASACMPCPACCCIIHPMSQLRNQAAFWFPCTFLQTAVSHLRLEATVARADAGLPHGAPLAARLEWLWQCHMHFWAFRFVDLLMMQKRHQVAGLVLQIGMFFCATMLPMQKEAWLNSCAPSLPRQSDTRLILHVVHRLLAAAAALCSLAIVVAEATIAGVLPNLSVVSAALRSTSGGWAVAWACCNTAFCGWCTYFWPHAWLLLDASEQHTLDCGGSSPSPPSCPSPLHHRLPICNGAAVLPVLGLPMRLRLLRTLQVSRPAGRGEGHAQDCKQCCLYGLLMSHACWLHTLCAHLSPSRLVLQVGAVCVLQDGATPH